jgi:hypothetical protein
VPSGPGFSVRFWFLSRLKWVVREDPRREWFVCMIEDVILSHLIVRSTLPRGCHKVPNQPLDQPQRDTPMTANYALDADGPSPHTVQLGEGPPTKEELLVYYPAKFTWKQLKTFVNSGYFCMLYVSVAIVESSSPGILGYSNVTRNSRNDMIVGLKGSRPSMEAMVIDSSFSNCTSHPL